MKLALFVGIPIIACSDDARPTRVIDCVALADKYAVSCVDHLGITVDVSGCPLVDERQGGGLANTVDRAAVVCEEASASPDATDVCDKIFVCNADGEGLSALTRNGRVTGTATVEGDPFTFDTDVAWVWVGTKTSGNPGDFAALFTLGGRPWYFKLEDFAERARTQPFRVDAARPIKLENGEDNVELVTGTVTVTTFAIGGAFDIRASGSDAEGDAIDLHLEGTFD